MATEAKLRTRLTDERLFFMGMAAAMAIVTFVGFAPTYYLAGSYAPRAPALTPTVHLHGALCTGWILFLMLQTGLIAAGRRDVHRVAGIAGVAIAVAVVATGLFVAIHSHRRVHTAVTDGTMADPYVFFVFPVTAASIFALFVGLGLLNRRRPDYHKRLMILATASMIGPALARIVGRTTTIIPSAIGALILINLFIAALAVHDIRTRGRLHPATLWGGGFLLVSEPLRVAIGFSEPWRAFARMVMS
ncbi:hypothetical protein [Sphingopyxis sp.]|uniref:hypothetical protein n=1 Tax=Sphingopyxis sp. TaxID=1908224 RepID=UPI003D6CD659